MRLPQVRLAVDEHAPVPPEELVLPEEEVLPEELVLPEEELLPEEEVLPEELVLPLDEDPSQLFQLVTTQSLPEEELPEELVELDELLELDDELLELVEDSIAITQDSLLALELVLLHRKATSTPGIVSSIPSAVCVTVADRLSLKTITLEGFCSLLIVNL